jgi:hypothetical protein
MRVYNIMHDYYVAYRQWSVTLKASLKTAIVYFNRATYDQQLP